MYLGIDIGTSSVKTALLKKNGDIITNQSKYPDNIYKKTEHETKYIENTVKKSIKNLLKKVPNSRGNVASMGICSHGPSLLFVDYNGYPLTNIINWYDKRSIEEARYLRDSFNNFKKDATSFEAKVMWFKKHHSFLFNSKNYILYPKDYIIYKLVDEFSFDKSTASTINFYNSQTHTWKFNRCNINNEVFPKTKSPWEVVGNTSTKYALECGLSEGIPVIAGGIDAYCEALGAGAINNGEVVEGTGTSTCISMCLPQNEKFDLHVVPNKSIIMNTLSFTGGSIEWILNVFSESLDKLNNLDLKHPVSIIFLPYLLGERSPIWDEKAQGAFIGLNAETDEQDIIKSVIQGVSFDIKQNIEALEQYYEVESIRAVGGGAENENILINKSIITNKEYIKMKNIDSAAIGAAILAVYGTIDMSLKDIITKWIKKEKSVSHTILKSDYEKLYQIFTNLYEDLKPHFHKLYEIDNQ